MDLENEVVMWYVKYLVVHNSIMEEGWGAPPPKRTAKKKKVGVAAAKIISISGSQRTQPVYKYCLKRAPI